jgi:hypothetical protein
VTVNGSAFPPNTTVFAHLAPLGGSGGTGNEYANYAIVATTGTGDFNMIFAMPAVWPNGTPIPTGRLVILVATADFSRQASATFDYRGVTTADDQPTLVPTNTAVPVLPTETPTVAPTVAPTEVPTEAPTEVPTEAPTETPMPTPTEIPLEVPTETPTETPTIVPVDTGDTSTMPPVLDPVLPEPPVDPAK